MNDDNRTSNVDRRSVVELVVAPRVVPVDWRVALDGASAALMAMAVRNGLEPAIAITEVAHPDWNGSGFQLEMTMVSFDVHDATAPLVLLHDVIPEVRECCPDDVWEIRHLSARPYEALKRDRAERAGHERDGVLVARDHLDEWLESRGLQDVSPKILGALIATPTGPAQYFRVQDLEAFLARTFGPDVFGR